jgi:DNA-directed RNA polymerase specialized sigma24 family protein
MSASSSVTVWIKQLKSGDSLAAQRLWEAYFQRMVELARRKLAGASPGAADEEDVALSAFHSFCVGAREGRFTQVLDRDNLWPLLMAITLHKSVDLIRGANRRKRGGGAPGEDVRARQVAESLSDVVSREPTPEFAAELADTLQRLLLRLDVTGDPTLRQIAVLRMQGYSTTETAARMDCVRRTVERKLQLIARLWEKDEQDVSEPTEKEGG